ncbi:Ankyrin repeat [Dillenia turbinata]|uniref:Ankyrin repeat n=1 Tax=Dillenia turbinata TaxID=194707 RepID=A0AAN8V014_9MAGN
MTLFANSSGGFLAGKQVFPVIYESEVSQRLLDFCHVNDVKSALDCIDHPFVDVNFIGVVSLKAKKTEVGLYDESAHEVRVDYEEFKTEVTALFLASHTGNVTLVRRLLSVGANVNQKLFRGYATTAAVREGHVEVLKILINACASQLACEEALLEACCLGQARPSELLMGSDLIRPQVAVHGLVIASTRGFCNVVDTLIKCGVNANETSRMLLQSSRPSLHTNVDCNALVAAIVSRQISVVQLLLQAGVRTDIQVRLGAWAWDTATGEELRVGAGLAEPYGVTWCAVEYFEASGAILQMLLKHVSPNSPNHGRTVIHHGILCKNARAVDVLLKFGADVEFPIQTVPRTNLRPIHLAARLGLAEVLRSLSNSGCNVNSQTESGETALMICARYKHEECLRVLALAGADFGILNSTHQSASSIAGSTCWNLGFQQVLLDVIRAGELIKSSNPSVFSTVVFVTRSNEVGALKKLIDRSKCNLNEQDERGYTAVMVAAAGGHMEALQLLIHAGADVKLRNKNGKTAIALAEENHNSEKLQRVMLEYALKKEKGCSAGIDALHCAARHGDLASVGLLTSKGYDVNVCDANGYTPLMLAARAGHGHLCEVLISLGAKCDIENARHETALSLARKNGNGSIAVRVILNELARKLVLGGSIVRKHTKQGKGSSHMKELKMVPGAGILRWGKSSKRNVVCVGAEVGPSSTFRWNRRRKFDADEQGLFHVTTTKKKEVHFVCDGGNEMAQLWVRGIKLVTREAIFGNKVNNA